MKGKRKGGTGKGEKKKGRGQRDVRYLEKEEIRKREEGDDEKRMMTTVLRW